VTTSLFDILKTALPGRVLANEPMARHTSWRIGGPADLFIRPLDCGELIWVLGRLKEHGVPWQVIGGGSNLLVRDGGIRGAVIHPVHLDTMAFDAGGKVRAGAGLRLMRLIRAAAERGLGGLERLAGIPATVGGAVVMNAGAGGQDLAGAVHSVTLAGPDGREEWPAATLRFGYRRSAVPADRIVTEARLQLHPADPAALEVEIADRLRHRRTAQGVGKPNAGSVFKNPPRESAWRLIDRAGLRGAVVGRAQVSERHSNFIVNCGGARAADVLALIDRIRERVEQKTGIRLEPEIRVVGSDEPLTKAGNSLTQ
jgi:UDP-N-acetylmuramate dehydrogenase